MEIKEVLNILWTISFAPETKSMQISKEENAEYI